MEVGGEGGRLYTYRYTVTTRMTSALRWAVMRAILMFHNCEGQSHKTVSTDHNLFEEKGEPKRIRTEVLPCTSLTQREIVYLSLYCYHRNDSCIKVGSSESHFNVSLTVRDKVTRQCPQTTTFLKRIRESRSGIEPRSFCLPA